MERSHDSLFKNQVKLTVLINRGEYRSDYIYVKSQEQIHFSENDYDSLLKHRVGKTIVINKTIRT